MTRTIALTLATVANISGSATVALAAPSPPPTATAAPTASPGASGLQPFDESKLTPAQQDALRLIVIKTSQNPVGNITVVPFQNNFNYGVGPYARFQYNLNVQPVLPIMLGPKMNLISRTIIPVVNQPSGAPPIVCLKYGCGSTLGISDIQEQLYFAPKTNPGGLIWGIGPIFQVPSASPGVLGSGKWSAGPDAVALVMPGQWVLGTLVTQFWSFAGQANRPNVSSFLVQPFANYNLKDGWAISTGPGITANWTAPQNKWTVPLGGGIAKTFKAGDQLMSIAVSYYSYVARPIGAPQTQLRVQWSLLYPVRRGINMQDLMEQVKQSQ
jgi:hypothetical protein